MAVSTFYAARYSGDLIFACVLTWIAPLRPAASFSKASSFCMKPVLFFFQDWPE